MFKTNFISKANNSVVSMLYTLIKHATIGQSESPLEWFKYSDWLYKTKALKSSKPSVKKPSKFTFYDSLQTKIVRQVASNTFAWSFKSLRQNLEVKCSVNFSRIMAHKNTLVFSHDEVENK